MTINLHLPNGNPAMRPTITVIGVGGAGGNAVNNMIASKLEGVNFVVANTDAQALDNSLTERTIQLGAGLTKGLGAGAKPEIGKAAAEEASEEIAAHIEGSNMVFITAGMGGGTGTGAAAVVARLAKDQGILTVGVVTKPFQFEGTHRMKLAEAGLKELQEYVDTLIIIPNQNIFRIANEKTTFADAFKMADEVLHSGVRGITDLMMKPGLINLDFADIRTVMGEMGKAMMGTGEANGDRRAIEAAEAAISNPLLDDVSLKGARAVLINITGGMDITLFEVDEAANRIREEVDPEANIIVGSALSDRTDGRIRVSVVATGIDAQQFHTQSNAQKIASSTDQKKPYSYNPHVPPKQTEAPKPAAVTAQPPRQTFEQPARPAAPKAPTQQEAMAARIAAMEQRSAFGVRPEPATSQENDMPEPPRFRLPDQQAMPERVQAEEYEAVAHAARAEMREAATLATAISAVRRPAAQPQAEEIVEEEAAVQPRGGFFARMAEVGRALSSSPLRMESKPQETAERVSVVQRSSVKTETSQPPAKAQDDQYLDIPAFLRRQAN